MTEMQEGRILQDRNKCLRIPLTLISRIQRLQPNSRYSSARDGGTFDVHCDLRDVMFSVRSQRC